jgi:hypothetical protein
VALEGLSKMCCGGRAGGRAEPLVRLLVPIEGCPHCAIGRVFRQESRNPVVGQDGVESGPCCGHVRRQPVHDASRDKIEQSGSRDEIGPADELGKRARRKVCAAVSDLQRNSDCACLSLPQPRDVEQSLIVVDQRPVLAPAKGRRKPAQIGARARPKIDHTDRIAPSHGSDTSGADSRID